MGFAQMECAVLSTDGVEQVQRTVLLVLRPQLLLPSLPPPLPPLLLYLLKHVVEAVSVTASVQMGLAARLMDGAVLVQSIAGSLIPFIHRRLLHPLGYLAY